MLAWPVFRLLLVIIFIKETPYFHITKDQIEKTKVLLDEIYKKEWVDFEFEKARNLFHSEKTESSKSCISAFKNPRKRYLAMIGVYLFFVQQ